MTIVILTGAGISADSGVQTFRDEGGLWAEFDWRTLATPEAFRDQPAEVHRFYNMRRSGLKTVEPNAAHHALAMLEQRLAEQGKEVVLVTQNVDDLHRRAGSTSLIQMHGRLDQIRCTACGAVMDWHDPLSVETPCPSCGAKGGTLRPNIVWFGEMPMGLRSIDEAMARASEFVAIGTSGSVYPAAGLVAEARSRGIPTRELNLEPADNAALFDNADYGRAADIVPAWVDTILKAE